MTAQLAEAERTRLGGELIGHFTFPFNGFDSPVLFTDAVGFRVRKGRDNGNASSLNIYIPNEEFQKETSRKALVVTTNYGEEVGGGIKLSSTRESLYNPLSLAFQEFSYDLDSKELFENGKEIPAKDLLSKVIDVHERPSKLWGGFYTRCRLWFWRILLPAAITYFDLFLIYLLWIISGEKIKDSIMRRLIDNTHSEKPQKIEKEDLFEKTKKINFFGYEAKRWSVIFYCSVHLIIYVIVLKLGLYSFAISHIFANTFLAGCYVVVSFAVTESLIPTALKTSITKITPNAFRDIAFKSIAFNL